MSHKTDLLPRRDGESLTDWTLRFLQDAQLQLRVAQDEWRRQDDDRRRLVDLYHACTPRETEFAEPGDD